MRGKFQFYQEEEARDGMHLCGVAFCHDVEMGHHDPHNCSHASGAYEEHIPVLELFGWFELEDEAVVDACFLPRYDVASIQEQMKEQEAEHAVSPSKWKMLNWLVRPRQGKKKPKKY